MHFKVLAINVIYGKWYLHCVSSTSTEFKILFCKRKLRMLLNSMRTCKLVIHNSSYEYDIAQNSWGLSFKKTFFAASVGK